MSTNIVEFVNIIQLFIKLFVPLCQRNKKTTTISFSYKKAIRRKTKTLQKSKFDKLLITKYKENQKNIRKLLKSSTWNMKKVFTNTQRQTSSTPL